MAPSFSLLFLRAATRLTLLGSILTAACSSPDTREGQFPCDVDGVIQGWCVRCHSNPPVMDAPFPLGTYGDTQADLPGTGQHVWMAIEQVLTPTVYMPPDAPYLTDAGVRTLLEWIQAGAPPAAAGTVCD